MHPNFTVDEPIKGADPLTEKQTSLLLNAAFKQILTPSLLKQYSGAVAIINYKNDFLA